MSFRLGAAQDIVRWLTVVQNKGHIMNTPEPCCRCDNLYWNVLYEEDVSYGAECMVGLPMGDCRCPSLHTTQAVRQLEKPASARA